MLKNQPQNSSEARILLMEYIDLKILKTNPKFERSENFAYGLYILEKIKPFPNIYAQNKKYILHNFIFFENKKTSKNLNLKIESSQSYGIR